MSDTRDLGLILDAKIPLIAIESPDERRVLHLLLRLAMQRTPQLHEWSVPKGLRRGGFGSDVPGELALHKPEALLAHIAEQPEPALTVSHRPQRGPRLGRTKSGQAGNNRSRNAHQTHRQSARRHSRRRSGAHSSRRVQRTRNHR